MPQTETATSIAAAAVPPEPVTSKSAIRDAIAQLDGEAAEKTEQGPKNGKDTKETTKTTQPTEEEKETEKLEHAQALQLYKALKDPDQRESVIEFIAKQAGYSKAPLETKAEIKEVKDQIKGDLAEALGEEFGFLTDKLGPALDKIITKKLQEGLAETKAALEEQEQAKQTAASEKALGKLAKDFFGTNDKGEVEALPDNVAKGMKTFMDKVPADPDMSVADYLEYAFFSTIGKLGLTRKDPKTETRTNKNRNDAPSRLASDRTGPGSVTPDVPNSKTITRRQAIEAAMNTLAEQDK